MAVAQPAFQPQPLGSPAAPLGAVVARQLSAWPFAARTERLFLLVDPLPDERLRRGLLRAMEQAFFQSHCYSQTRAVREAALAAHYVLRHHNAELLPQHQISAASAVAAVRGDVAIVALTGHSAAYAWRDGELTGQEGVVRVPRPLGLEPDPPITLWSTPLASSDRLVLVCGASQHANPARLIQEMLTVESATSEAEEKLAVALGDTRPAGVLVVGSGSGSHAGPLRLGHRRETRQEPTTMVARSALARSAFPRRPVWQRLAPPILGLLLLVAVAVAALVLTPMPGSVESDTRAAAMIAASYRVDPVTPWMAVLLGPSAVNVVDMAVGDAALYTLDVGESSIRAFALDAVGQQPTPDSLVARAGSVIDSSGHRLSTPVAIEYLAGSAPGAGALTVIDQARSVVQIDVSRRLNLRAVPDSAGWQELGALGSDSAGGMLFLDTGARQLLHYGPLTQRSFQPARVLLDGSRAPSLAFEHVAEVTAVNGAVVLRLDDGSLSRLGDDGAISPIAIQTSDGQSVAVASLALDRSGGLYVADPANARVLQVGLDGTVLRALSDPALAGVRSIQSSLDGQRLYGLVASGVIAFDVPGLQ